jgi:hypothetical protein
MENLIQVFSISDLILLQLYYAADSRAAELVQWLDYTLQDRTGVPYLAQMEIIVFAAVPTPGLVPTQSQVRWFSSVIWS